MGNNSIPSNLPPSHEGRPNASKPPLSSALKKSLSSIKEIQRETVLERSSEMVRQGALILDQTKREISSGKQFPQDNRIKRVFAKTTESTIVPFGDQLRS